MYTPWSHREAWLSQSIKTISFKQQQAMIIITIIISLSVSVLVHFQVPYYRKLTLHEINANG